MTYTGQTQAKEAREALGNALGALQQDSDIPKDVLAVAENIALAVGALFEAERASTEPDGKACVRNALGSLSQTLALLQDVRGEHKGVGMATEVIAKSMSALYPLTTVPTKPPPARKNDISVPPGGAPSAGATAPGRPSAQSPAQSPAQSAARPSGVPSAAPAAAASMRPSARPGLVSVPPKMPPPVGDRVTTEANIGATTQSNFYVGFSGEIANGGVFLATYEGLPVGTPIDLLVTLPGGFEFKVDGQVRFVRDPLDFTADSEPGMGIQFMNLPAQSRELILRFVRKRAPMFYDD